MFATIRTCSQCGRLRSIGYVHPTSISHERMGVPVGWYVRCGKLDENTNVAVSGAVWDVDWTTLGGDYQLLQRFLKMNAHCLVDCPRAKQLPKERSNQESLFEEELECLTSQR